MTALRLFDSMSRSLKPVQPRDGHTLRFYCCGPTVYGPAHIGNFRSFLVQDTLRRVLELSGQPTLHVRNITDVDDKTIRQSQAEQKSLQAFTDFWRDRFHADTRALNMLPPHREPGAVAHIPDMIRLIQRLVEYGHAYVSEDGSVYFKVDSFESYGKLSHLDSRELKEGAGERNGRPIDADEYQRDSMADFVLWKSRKPEDGDNYWESPWGQGRPGWHIECSTMSMKYLGESFDLHSGGIDLCFPHHENEIAQSEAASGQTFCRHWFHIAHLQVDGHKMSKSEGNLYTLDDLAARGTSPAELRYVLLAGHYRKPLNFTFDSLAGARSALLRLARAEQDLRSAAGDPERPAFNDLCPAAPDQMPDLGRFHPVFEALWNDLNIPEALGNLFRALHGIEKDVNAGALPTEDAWKQWRALHIVLLGLGLDLPAIASDDIPEHIRDMAARRWEAKKDRDFATADQLRDQLAEEGWTVQDARDGYKIVPSP